MNVDTVLHEITASISEEDELPMVSEEVFRSSSIQRLPQSPRSPWQHTQGRVIQDDAWKPFVQDAGSLLEDLWEQMQFKDAPPRNDGRVPQSTTSQITIRPQSFVPGVGMTTSSSWDRTTDSGANENTPPHPLAHGPLSQLCSGTLQSLGYSTMPRQLQLETDLLLEQLEAPVSTMSKASVSSPKNSRRRFRLGRRKAKTSSIPPSASLSQISSTSQGSRLQQYGSEYARHLSKTALAPPAPSSPHHSTKKVGHMGGISLHDPYLDPSIATGALIDIVALSSTKNTSVPAGYYRLPWPESVGSMPIQFYVKKEPSWDKATQRPCITACTLVYPDRREFVPPGYSIVKIYGTDEPVSLSSKERLCLCYRRSREGNPLTDLRWLVPSEHNGNVPNSYTVVEKSPRGHVATVGQPSAFLSYRQRLANLEVLRPFPLVASVTVQNSVYEDTDEEEAKARLRAYYATGGTIVPCLDIGRLHVMDRTTHDLQSPSSVKNRLHLIAASRRDASRALNDSNIVNGSDTELLDTSGVWDATASVGPAVADATSDTASLQGSESHDWAQEPVSKEKYTTRDTCLWLSRSLMDPDSIQHVQDALAYIPEVDFGGAPSEDVDHRLSARCALLVPLLTACYTRHGESSVVALRGVAKLVRESKFFDDDVGSHPGASTNSSRLITCLDVTIQVVCDVAMTGVNETCFGDCVEIVEEAVRLSSGNLNTRTLGYVVRFYLFVYCFGSSLPLSNDGSWPPAESLGLREHTLTIGCR